MSEFQYHEWQTIDRLLTPSEQRAVGRLSSHIHVNSSQAVVTYNWGDFKYDPKQVLLDYFDAYFYLANWGSLRLMFRFPKDLLDKEAVEQYCDEEFVHFETIGDNQVLDIGLNQEDTEWMDVVDVNLSDFISLRAELIDGNYRLLYLARLKAADIAGGFVDDGEEDEDWGHPPIPPGLKKLSPALQNFVRVFGIDPYLVQAAAEASPDLQDLQTVDYRSLLSRLPREECDDYLARLLEGESGVKLSLRKRLKDFPLKGAAQVLSSRSFEELEQRADQLKRAEGKRAAEAARRKHVADMTALSERAPQVWQKIEDLLEYGKKNASVYDEVTRLLINLNQLADFQNNQSDFLSRVRDLANKYSSRTALMGRWQTQGWIKTNRP